MAEKLVLNQTDDNEHCETCFWLMREHGMKEFQEPKWVYSCGHPNAEQGCPYKTKEAS